MKLFKSFFEWLRKEDPVYNCDLYKDQGCSHVDGLLCDYPYCDMNRKYIEERDKVEDNLGTLIENQKDLPNEFNQVLNDNFWKLI